MNRIPEAQNETKQLQRLAAQRHLYSVAKRILGAEVFLGAPIAIAWGVASLNIPGVRSYAAFWGLLISLSDVLWLNPWQKRLREKAAKIQEVFDCDVLQLPWNTIKVGERPDPELIKEHADKFKKSPSRLSPLNNWYAPVVGELPIDVARILCQRSNCWWDSNQRRRYAVWVIAGLMITVVTILGLAFVGGLTVEKLFLSVIAPLAPALILAIRQCTEQIEAASRIDKLKCHAERIWSAALDNAIDLESSNKSRALQDEIYENRKRSPLVFDWIFRQLRSGYEIQMNHAAEEYAQEAKKRLGLI